MENVAAKACYNEMVDLCALKHIHQTLSCWLQKLKVNFMLSISSVDSIHLTVIVIIICRLDVDSLSKLSS